MTVRDDITISWDVSPRVIEVAAPSRELKVQDLYDTLRSKAADEGIDEPEITDGSGKEVLSATELVGLTVKLLNAKVKFEDRASPTDCDIYGGNLVALDENGDPMNPIEYATYVTVTYAKSSSATMVQAADITAIKEAIGTPTSTIAGDIDAVQLVLDFVHQVERARWKIANNQLIVYKDDGETPLRTFDLFGKDGNPTSKDIFERRPV